jgi:hypothetical protein
VRYPIAAVAGLAVTLSVAVSGCVVISSVTPASLIGTTLDTLNQRAGGVVPTVIQDASSRIGLSPEYVGDPEQDEFWVIVAACSSDERISTTSDVEVAVLPADAITTAVEEGISAGDYADAVGCEGRPHHG